MLTSNETGTLPGVEINFFMEINSNTIESARSILRSSTIKVDGWWSRCPLTPESATSPGLVAKGCREQVGEFSSELVANRVDRFHTERRRGGEPRRSSNTTSSAWS